MRLEDPRSTQGTAYTPETETAARQRGCRRGRELGEPRSLSSARTASPAYVDEPTSLEAVELAERFGFHELDIEDVLSKRQRA